jgi:hypothetical protein
MPGENELPTIEELEAKVEAEWQRDFETARRQEAQRRLRKLESLRVDREFAKRQAERQEEARERDHALARKAHLTLYGPELAEKVDPAATYSLIFISSRGATGFAIFSDPTRVAEVRHWLRFNGALAEDPERAAIGVGGVGLGAYVKRGELLAVNPTEQELGDLEKAARQEADARRQDEADRQAQANKEAEEEHLRRRYGARVG